MTIKASDDIIVFLGMVWRNIRAAKEVIDGLKAHTMNVDQASCRIFPQRGTNDEHLTCLFMLVHNNDEETIEILDDLWEGKKDMHRYHEDYMDVNEAYKHIAMQKERKCKNLLFTLMRKAA